MVRVEVEVAEGVDEIARSEVANLRDHHREERVAGDVEGDAEKEVGAALIELAAQTAVEDEELKERVTGRESHLRNLAGIPRADDESPRVRVLLDLRDDSRELVEASTIGAPPVAPLRAIDAAKLARLRVGPFVPDR